MKTIKFWTPKGFNGFMSNFYEAPFMLNGVIYPTNEHFFQSQKFTGTRAEQYILMLPTAAETAKEGKSRALPLRKDWEEVKETVMLTGLRAKFAQNEEIRKKLLDTGDAVLIENSPYDYYWGCGRDGSGKNRLGILLMQIRKELLLEKDTQYINDAFNEMRSLGFTAKEIIETLDEDENINHDLFKSLLL
ncbi:NADAR family protein [Paenibacillus illinoisensis]|uniref:NADAR family protein n=1 Tax=Paenibacillus illinoisensis TaxID=59845 RepID=UPI003018B28E